MKFKLCFFLLVFYFLPVRGQDVRPLKGVTPEEAYDAIKAIPLYSDKDVSSYVIFIKKSVKLHVHRNHTEQVIVLSGKGVLTLGNETIPIRKGDYIIIPKGVQHAVRVKGRKPLKVLSVQAPQFHGKDRFFID